MSNTYNSQLQSNNIDLQTVLQTLQSKAAGGYDEADSLIEMTMSTYTNSRVLSIGQGAFAYAMGLKSVNFPAVMTIGNSAFYSCEALTTVSFPVATTISSNAFYNCSPLTTASFPAAITIGHGAFQGCNGLTTVSFPVATTISTYAFNTCTALTTASFSQVTNIGGHAFAYCYSLATASFPQVTNIKDQAFRNCFRLSQLYLTGSSVCTLSNSNAFSSTPYAGYSTSFSGTPYIYVPSSLLTSYQTATNWTYFSSYFSAVGIEDEGGDTVIIITFYVEGTEYQAEQGMNWKDWCDSVYNIDGYVTDMFQRVLSNTGDLVCTSAGLSVGPAVTSSDLIEADASYKFQ